MTPFTVEELEPFTLEELDAAIAQAKESGIVTPIRLGEGSYYVIYSNRNIKAVMQKIRRLSNIRRYLRKGSLRNA